MKQKTKSIAFVQLVSLMTLLLLTGCVTGYSGAGDLRRLYQPPVLRLKANQPIQTVDGIYVPQVDEVWHSDPRFRDLEHQVINQLPPNNGPARPSTR